MSQLLFSKLLSRIFYRPARG